MVEESVRALKPRVTMVRFCGVLTLFLSKKSGTTKVDLHNLYLIDFSHTAYLVREIYYSNYGNCSFQDIFQKHLVLASVLAVLCCFYDNSWRLADT